MLQKREHMAGWIANCSRTERRMVDAARTVDRKDGAYGLRIGFTGSSMSACAKKLRWMNSRTVASVGSGRTARGATWTPLTDFPRMGEHEGRHRGGERDAARIGPWLAAQLRERLFGDRKVADLSVEVEDVRVARRCRDQRPRRDVRHAL